MFSLITLYGSNIGSVVGALSICHVDCHGRFPERHVVLRKHGSHAQGLDSHLHHHRVHHLVSSEGPIVTLFPLAHSSVLVPISTFGLFAIIASYIVLVMSSHLPPLTPSYGMANYKPEFHAADLWPTSPSQLLEKIGIYVYCMGFILFLLTQYVGSHAPSEV